METIEQSGRTVEDAVQSALKTLGRSRDEVDIEVIEEESRGLLGILGYSSARVRVTVKPEAMESAEPEREEPRAPEPERRLRRRRPEPRAEPEKRAIAEGERSPLAERAVGILERMLELMSVDARVEVTEDDSEAVGIEIHSSEDMGLLIGKRGQTLSSLQLLVAMMANREESQENRRRIILDAEGYRARRERTLRAMARSAAQRAKRSGRPVKLDALDPRERRIVHLALADDPGVSTRSEGEAPNRSVVVSARRRHQNRS